MILLFFLLFLSVKGIPAPVVSDASIELSCNDINNSRTLLGIIWSCITTIFLCTWVAIHPNLPRPIDTTGNTSFWRRRAHQISCFFRDKVVMFICALLVPEYILAWAIRQFIAATRIAKENGPCK
jgi:hypothetical protein